MLAKLKEMRDCEGAVRCTGLPDEVVVRFLDSHPALAETIDEAYAAHLALRSCMADFLRLDEVEQIRRVQADFVNFYPDDGVNPYVALAAHGPWIVTLKGAVIYDAGGYGMLGLGHAPKAVLATMARPQVMANVMTPNLSQLKFGQALKKEIGQNRGGCPYAKFMCLNSGSESVSLAARIIDTNAKLMTDPGARHAGRAIKRVAVRGAFHGRTEAPALYSDSSRKAYVQNLASYRNEHTLLTVEPYSVEQLKQVFADADRNGWFIEAVFIEPVMGEGDPGRSVTAEFYRTARELTQAHGSLLLIDSIQAGLRAHGVLSFVDYPGFENVDAPDLETFSKALNAGQYPLSVLAVNERAAQLYRKGTYGNTMTANPRALDVACTVLEALTPELRANVRQRGEEFVAKLGKLKAELPGYITKVQGTGLLFSCELSGEFLCYGAGSTEEWLREHGYGVIHGGANSLRFTPHFGIGADEVDLLVDGVRRALVEGPRKRCDEAA
ncbi:MAG: aminotransferase class III-fold pyridoxal phosphate-dependent enzyme [Rhodanobacteraceae bacterium]|nr:aminotransferase class III-fold pyridoxal phosphate-dependent enzyme [Rhodanobacteraceae bacterium]